MQATLYENVSALSKTQPEKIALQSETRPELSYGGLHDAVRDVIHNLCARGVAKGDRVGMLLSNRLGAEIAVLFLGISSIAALVPVNPDDAIEQTEERLLHLRVKHLIISEGDERFVSFAQKNNINLIYVMPAENRPVGRVMFFGNTLELEYEPDVALLSGAEDVAIILQTSGTTSKPKTILLKQKHIVAVAEAFIKSLGVTPQDRCLNIMPMFHYHGLIIATLTALMSGGSVACMERFQRDKFLYWLKTFRSTWYTAVSGLHQEVLAVAKGSGQPRGDTSLRFIRSSSNSLLPTVLAELEAFFGAPVVESYGVSEAGTLACNPVSVDKRKIGSVGVVVPGVELFIADVNRKKLPPGKIGEIVTRGPAMVDGYEESHRNAGSFVDGWFHTGDIGYLDEQGYLFIKGRVKEMIRKGQKMIVPFDLDKVLNGHPQVAEGCVFSIPSDRWGEDVAAAVVAKDKGKVSSDDIISYMAQHVPTEETPSVIVFVDAIPKNAIGKPLRISMARELNLVPA